MDLPTMYTGLQEHSERCLSAARDDNYYKAIH